MRRLLAPLVVLALSAGLVSGTSTSASAAPPTAAFRGAAGGDTTRVTLDVLDGLQLGAARLAVSQVDSGSQRTPRSTARSANLDAGLAGVGIGLLQNVEDAGPAAGTSSSSRELGAGSDLGVSVGALETDDTARWAGDAACVVEGPLASASTQTAGVRVDPADVSEPLLTTGVSRTTGTTELVAEQAGSVNNGLTSTATGTIADVSVLGVGIGVAGTSRLRTTATGNAGGASYDYDPGTVTITDDGATRTVEVGATEEVGVDLDDDVRATVSVTVNRPDTDLSEDGTSASASVAVVTVRVTAVSDEDRTVLTSSIDLLPLRSSAAVPDGGIDCPAPAPAPPVVSTPADGSTTDDTTPTYAGTGVAGASINLVVDGERQAGVTTVRGDGTWSVTPTTPIDQGPHTVSATQTLLGTESDPSEENAFVVDVDAPAAPVLVRPADGSVTNDRTPTYTGTAEPGADITVFEDGTAVGTGRTDEDGTFSIVSDRLDPGAHTVVARATDEAGNTSQDSNATTFTIDTTAPAVPEITQPEDGSTTTDTTPTISGTADPGSTVEVFVDGDSIGTTTADEDGQFEVTPAQPLDQGGRTATAVATDPAGNDSRASDPVDFTIDSRAPGAPVVTEPAEGSSTNDTTPTIRGTAEPGASVEVFVDEVSVGTTTADDDGDFSVTPGTPLAVGQRTATAVATDAAGNVSPTSDPVDFTVDDVAPAAPVLQTPADGSVIAERTPTYTGTAEPLSDVTVYEGVDVVGTGRTDATGRFSITSTRLDPGRHTVLARATDAAGNTSVDSNANTFRIDTAAPAAPQILVPADGSSTPDTTPTISGTAEPGALVEVFVDGVSVGTTTADADGAFALDSTPLSEAGHTATAVATDPAGNVSEESDPVDFTVDATDPAAPVLTAPADGSVTTDPTPAIRGTAEPGASVEVFVDGASVGTGTADDEGSFSVTPVQPLSDDLHTATAVATDDAGNGSVASTPVVFRVDATDPGAPVIAVPTDGGSTTDTTPTISGTAEPGVSVEVFVDGASVGTATADGNGAFSVTPTTPLEQGPHTTRATATDTAGNVSTPSDAVRFSVDSVAPDAPVVEDPADGSATNDPTPAVSGTADPGSSVEVFVDGTSVGTTTAEGDGTFSVTPTTPLTDGPHTATAVATDPAGNASPTSDPVAFAVDTTAPAVPVVTTPADGSSTTDATPTISGTADPGSSVEVFVDGESVGTTTAGEDGGWTLDASLLRPGQHAVNAVATDEAGNTADSGTNTFDIVAGDSPAPVILTPEEGAEVTGPDISVCGTGVAGYTVQLDQDGNEELLGSVVVDEDGDWCIDVELPEGDTTVNAVQIDPDGEVSAVASRSFEVLADDDGNGNGDGNGSGNGNGNGNGSSANGNDSDGGGHLASTGGPSLLFGLGALLLIAAGSTTVVVSRRRRRG